MKKQIFLILIITIFVSGCGESKSALNEKVDNGLLEVQSSDRVLTASDVKVKDTYQFAVSDAPVNGYDTYVLSDILSIKLNNDQKYSLYYSDKQFQNVKQAKRVDFEDDKQFNPKQTTYYCLVADGDIDVVISTNN